MERHRAFDGAFEITELLLLTLIFAGLPLASRADEHVTLDFIDMVLSNSGRLLLRRFVDLACGLLFLGLAYRVWIKADKIAGYGDTTEVLRVPVGPFVYFMAIMVAVTGIVHLTKVFFPAPPRGAVTFDPDKPTTPMATAIGMRSSASTIIRARPTSASVTWSPAMRARRRARSPCRCGPCR